MVIRHKIEGYEAFFEFVKQFNTRDEVYIVFSGSDETNRQSWCSDCRNAEPVIEEALAKYASPKTHFVVVKVGNRESWRDMNNSFRKDPNLHLMVLPTIIKWQTPKRLEGEQCEKLDILQLLFEDD